MKKEDLWQAVLAQIQLNLSPANFATWFRNTDIFLSDKGMIVVSVPSNFAKEWLEKKYEKMILKTLRDLDETIKNIEFKVVPLTPEKTPRPRAVQAHPAQLNFEEFSFDKETSLNPRYTFDNFVVGPFNELAQAAAWAVSETPGSVYNPFFIYGGVGLGKTHLLQAIGNKVMGVFPEKKIKYTTSEKFTGEIINSIKNKSIDKLKDEYKKYDLLIVDDVQFLSGKEKTQEEFFHLFNALYQDNKQIIISSDRPPKAIAALEERLKSRFEGGMIADISIPDFESRIAILKQKAQEKSMIVDDGSLEYIASAIQSNIRKLEGALNRLVAAQKINNEDLNPETTKRILKKVIHPNFQRLTFQKVIQIVSEFYSVPQKEIFLESRKKEIVKPRQLIMYFLRKEMNFSFPSIGKKLGGKDHTTVIYSFEKVCKDLEKNEGLAEEINSIREKLYSE